MVWSHVTSFQRFYLLWMTDNRLWEKSQAEADLINNKSGCRERWHILTGWKMCQLTPDWAIICTHASWQLEELDVRRNKLLRCSKGTHSQCFAVQPTTPVSRINENVYRTLCNDIPGGPSESCESPTVWALVKMASLGGPWRPLREGLGHPCQHLYAEVGKRVKHGMWLSGRALLAVHKGLGLLWAPYL